MMLLRKKPTLTTVIIKGRKTIEELEAIHHYKDLIFPQFIWDYKPFIDMLMCIGIDCYMVNSILRGIIPLSKLSIHDRNQFYRIVNNLSSAISKCYLRKDVDVIKGLTDPEWIEKYKVGEKFGDDGFGSFSPSRDIAHKYAGIGKKGKKVFMILTLEKGSNALYLDDGNEPEYILPRGNRYVVSDIVESVDGVTYYVERAK